MLVRRSSGDALSLKSAKASEASEAASCKSRECAGSSLRHKLWQDVLEARKAAELCSDADLNPRPELEVERVASDHSSLDNEAQRNYSTESLTAWSNS